MLEIVHKKDIINFDNVFFCDFITEQNDIICLNKYTLYILLVYFFRYTLYKAQTANPEKSLAMLRVQDLHLAKVILFYIGFSSVLLSISQIICIFDINHLSMETLHLGILIG